MSDDIFQDHIQDVQRKYINSYVGIKGDKSRIPIYVNTIEEGHVFKGVPLGKKKSVTVEGKLIDTSWPQLGVVNVGKLAILLERKVPRAVQRGFVFDNVECTILADNACAIAAIEDPLLSKEGKELIVGQVFCPTYYSVEGAYTEIITGLAIARAINNKFWIGVSPFSETPVLGYKKWVVGNMLSERRLELKKQAKHLREELSMYMEVV